MAGVNKNFVVKNGLEVNSDLIFADATNQRVGINTNDMEYTLHVNGGIGVTYLYTSGIGTFDSIHLAGSVTAGTAGAGSTGQYLVRVGSGVSWQNLPASRSSQTFTATAGQTLFLFSYTVGQLDVFINGVKLSPSEYTANDTATVILNAACFGDETVELISYGSVNPGYGYTGIYGISLFEEGSPVGTTGQVVALNFVGAAVTSTATGIAATVYLTENWTKNSQGVYSLNSVGVGTTNPRFALEVGAVGASGTSLWVNGNARVTGILTVGSSSIVLDGANNTINVGSGITINGNTGIVSASNFYASGLQVGVLTATTIVYQGATLSSSQWVSTAAGIHTLGNVGIGTTNPISGYDLTVGKSSSLGQVSNSLKVYGYGEINGLVIKGNSSTGSGVYYGDNVIITQNPAATFTGSQNVAIGANSFTTPGAAGDTVAIGYYALNSVGNNSTISTWNGNIGVGAYAGASCTTALYNTLVGWSAGRDFTVANYNTFIGQQAGRYITTGQSNVIIGSYNGNSIDLDIRTSSNNVVLSDGAGNIRFYANSSGNVGLGTTNPTNTLNVSGGIGATTLNVTGLSTFAGITTVTGPTLFAKQLNVSGVGTFNSLLKILDSTFTGTYEPSRIQFRTGEVVIDSISHTLRFQPSTTDNSGSILFFSRTGATGGSLRFRNSATLDFDLSGDINVSGITTTSTLNVSGVSTFTGAVSFGTTAYFGADDEIVLNNKFKIYTDASNTYLKNFDTNTGGDLYIQSDVTLIQKYDGTETIAQFTEGAGVQLNYQGQHRLSTVATGVIVGDNSAGVVHIPNELRIGTVGANQSDASIMIANSSGVGIGTTNPTSKLTVKGNTSLETLNVSGVSTFVGLTTFKNYSTITELGNSSYEGIRFVSGSNFAIVSSDSLGNLILNSQSTNNRYAEINGYSQFYANSGNVQLNNGNSGTTKVGSAITFTSNTGEIFTTGNARVGVSTASGVILTSPNGTKYQLFVEDDGTLKTVAV